MTTGETPSGMLARTRGALADDIVRHVERRIASGGLSAGAKLPPERELAAELGVSRSALREALMRLQVAGLVERRQGSGTRIAESARVAETIGRQLGAAGANATHAAELRDLVEPQVAGLAAVRISADELAALREILEGSAGETDPDRSLQLDLDFHLAVARAARNPLLESLCDFTATQTLSARVHSHLDEAGRRLSHAGHARVLAALEEADAVAARVAMAGHLREVHELISAREADVRG